MSTLLQNNRNFIIAFVMIMFITLSLRLMYSYSPHFQKLSDDNALHPTYFTTEQDSLSMEEKKKLSLIQEEIDFKYCNGPCRFLNFLHIQEQETRAQLHLRHLSYTAGLINRTIVLPNVSGSRIGSCLPYDFEYYYDIEWAKSNNQHFNYITMNDFKSWLKERKLRGVPVIDQVLSVYDKNEPQEAIPRKVFHCFSGYTIPKSPYNQIMAWDVYWRLKKQREELLINFLQGNTTTTTTTTTSDLSSDNADLQVIHLEVFKANPFSHIEEAMIPIPYSTELHQFADATAQSLGSYIAVHWRMERAMKNANLLHCAEHLVSLLEEKDMNKSQVFMLTDYPHTFTAKQQELAIEEHSTQEDLLKWLQSTSDTFLPQNFTSGHHRAIHYLFEHHTFNLFETTMNSRLDDPPQNWRLMPIPESLKRMNVIEGGGLDMIDSGWLGILDKLMAIRSHSFFAGNGDICGRGRSTFTAQIVAERAALGKSNVHYFGQKQNATSLS